MKYWLVSRVNPVHMKAFSTTGKEGGGVGTGICSKQHRKVRNLPYYCIVIQDAPTWQNCLEQQQSHTASVAAAHYTATDTCVNTDIQCSALQHNGRGCQCNMYALCFDLAAQSKA